MHIEWSIRLEKHYIKAYLSFTVTEVLQLVVMTGGKTSGKVFKLTVFSCSFLRHQLGLFSQSQSHESFTHKVSVGG